MVTRHPTATFSLSGPFAPRTPPQRLGETYHPSAALFARFLTTMVLSDFLPSWTSGLRLFGVPRPGQRLDRSLTESRTSRVPHKRHPYMPQVFDSGAPIGHSRYRVLPYCFPLHPTGSARPTLISELNTVPAHSPVNA